MNAPQRSPQFIHLRLHSEFSIADGLVRIDDVVEAAAADSQPALAITDLANLFGMVKFYKAARSKGIKPVIVEPDGIQQPRGRLDSSWRRIARSREGGDGLGDDSPQTRKVGIRDHFSRVAKRPRGDEDRILQMKTIQLNIQARHGRLT